MTSTVLVICLVIIFGVSYQYQYKVRKAKYTEMITHFYHKYFDGEPDAIGLRHWVLWAMTKWGIDKVERLGFYEVARREGQWSEPEPGEGT